LLQRTNPNLLACLAWLNTLGTERGLLSDSNPTAAYAAEALHGNHERLHQIQKELDIPPSSWFWRELVLAQIREAKTLSDDPFHHILLLLDRNKVNTY
jgi:hypothetical protein